MAATTNKRLLRIALAVAALGMVGFVVWIIHEANIGRDNAFFRLVRATPYGDKIGHFFLSGLVALAANFLCRGKTWLVAKIPIPIGTLVVLIAFMIEEASQAYLPTRSFDLVDAAANIAGIACFSLPHVLARRRASD